MSLQKDLDFGLNKEKVVLKMINKFFNRNICQSLDKFSRYDFYDYKYSYELKSRRCEHDTYPTTMIAADKMKDKTIFLFLFTDGLYYIKYKKTFLLFETKLFVRPKREGINDGINDVKKLYVYIPIEKLKKIEINDDDDDVKDIDFTMIF